MSFGWEDANTWRYTTCAYCGKGFKDDCGDVFCSGSCERMWERENETDRCEDCGEDFHKDELEDGLCEDCLEERESEEDDE